MTQNAALIALFRANGNRLTASQIWDNAKTVGRKYTGRISELRDMGYEVKCEKMHDDPKNNIYTLSGAARAAYVNTPDPGMVRGEVFRVRASGGSVKRGLCHSLPTPAPVFKQLELVA